MRASGRVAGTQGVLDAIEVLEAVRFSRMRSARLLYYKALVVQEACG